jgi:tetratricopeptide (TPR) repeat protein
VIGWLATSAGAQPAPAPKKRPTQQELDRARAHFKAAEAAKARRDYKTSVTEYLAAYELFEDPEFFFDIGEIYRLAGDEPGALTYYQKYLTLDPNGRGAPAARTAVDDLRRSIAAKQDAARRTPDEDATKRAADDAAKRTPDEGAAKRAAEEEPKHKVAQEPRRKADEGAANHAANAAAPTNPSPAGAPSVPGGRGLRIAGLAAGGAGVIALGVGVGFGLRAKGISDETSRWDRFDQARYDQGKAAERNMLILTGIGAAGLVAGSVLYYLGHRTDMADDGARSAVRFVPAIGHGEIAVTAGGSF